MNFTPESPFLFQLAAQRSQYLAQRQATIAGNIANATTPGFIARDVVDFRGVLDQSTADLAVTDKAHMSPVNPASMARVITRPLVQPWDVAPTGNAVSLDQELTKAGDNAKDYALTSGIVRSFHRMWIAGLKG